MADEPKIYRLDPFKNIIDWSSSGLGFVVAAGFGQDISNNGEMYNENGNVIGSVPVHGFYALNGSPDGDPGTSILNAEVTSCAITKKGDAAFIGYVQDGRSPPDIGIAESNVGSCLYKMSLGGGTLWSDRAPGNNVTMALAIAPITDDGCFVLFNDSGDRQLTRYGSGGNIVWQIDLGTSSTNPFRAPICASPDGAICVVSGQTSGITAYDGVSGTPMWSISASNPVLSPGATKKAFAYVDRNVGAITKADITTGGAIWSASMGGNSSVCDISPSGDVFGTTELGNVSRVFGFNGDSGSTIWSSSLSSGGFGGITNPVGAGIVAPGKKLVSFVHLFANAVDDDPPTPSGIDRRFTTYAYNQKTGGLVWSKLFGISEPVGHNPTPGYRTAQIIGRNP